MWLWHASVLSVVWSVIVLAWYLVTRWFETRLAMSLASVLVPPLYLHERGLDDTVLAVAVMQNAQLKDGEDMATRVAAAAWKVAGPDGFALRMDCAEGHQDPCGHRVDREAVAYWRELATMVDKVRYPAV